MEFISAFFRDNKNMVDSYFRKKDKSNIKYTKLDPMQNYYTLETINDTGKMTNPFKDVQDSVKYARELREKSYR